MLVLNLAFKIFNKCLVIYRGIRTAEKKMKKIIMIAAASLMAIGSANAGNAFGDGSPENHYIAGKVSHSGVNNELTGNSRTYTRANGFGGGSVEDSYVIGHEKKSGLSKHGVPASEMAHSDDGSPVNHR